MQLNFWSSVLQSVDIIPFDENSANIAVNINTALKKKRQQIDIADLFIAATAVANNMSIATLNRKHFDRIIDLKIIE